MNPGGRELIAADESTVVSETLLDTIVMEDGESDGSFSNSPWTDEGNWSEVFSEIDDLLDQLATSETGPWRRRRQLSRYTRCEFKPVDSLVAKVADLVWT